MTPAQFIQKRQPGWKELEALIDQMESAPDRSVPAAMQLRFGQLYRSACTDLSLSQAWRLPRELQLYLEGLVSRSHSNLYSQPRKRWNEVKQFFVETIPRLVFSDVNVRICTALFYVTFLLCGVLAFNSREFAADVVGESVLESYEQMHADMEEAELGDMIAGTGFYILNNVSIDLMTFGMGILGGIGSIFAVVFNAVHLGTVIGFLMTTPAGPNITRWVIAHAPFELTAIGISAGAGLRIGYSLISAGGRSRLRALREEARAAIPIIAAAALLTLIAGFIEAFLGPAKEGIGLVLKYVVGALSVVFLILYFLVLGFIQTRRYRRGVLR
ncbi:MAG: stage II sporulation protein M [Leptospiraceae bacterium]|nr:stage II sporulation protein M [Leptospiraceae bacterium]